MLERACFTNPEPYSFTNETRVSVDASRYMGSVYVLRDGKYIPMVNLPDLEGDKLTFYFMKPETGMIL